MKNLELNVSERIFSLAILNNFKGNLDVMASILEDIKQFPIIDEEWVKAERVLTDEKGEVVTDLALARQWKWNDEKGGLKPISISKDTSKYLIETIDKKSNDGELSLQDKAAITLRAKLK